MLCLIGRFIHSLISIRSQIKYPLLNNAIVQWMEQSSLIKVNCHKEDSVPKYFLVLHQQQHSRTSTRFSRFRSTLPRLTPIIHSLRNLSPHHLHHTQNESYPYRRKIHMRACRIELHHPLIPTITVPLLSLPKHIHTTQTSDYPTQYTMFKMPSRN